MPLNFTRTASVAMAFAIGAVVVAANAADSSPADRRIFITVEAPVPLEDAWRLWTTREGLESFFGREAHIDPKVDGNLSIYFYPDRPPGVRGAEDMRILAFEPMRRLSFTWNAPVELPYARMQRSIVTVRFEAIGKARTRVSLIHDHFGDGPEWNRTIDYFAPAWSRQVIPYFLYAAEHGSVKWGDMSVASVEAVVTR